MYSGAWTVCPLPPSLVGVALGCLGVGVLSVFDTVPCVSAVPVTGSLASWVEPLASADLVVFRERPPLPLLVAVVVCPPCSCPPKSPRLVSWSAWSCPCDGVPTATLPFPPSDETPPSLGCCPVFSPCSLACRSSLVSRLL